jgi:hypothetical protein
MELTSDSNESSKVSLRSSSVCSAPLQIGANQMFRKTQLFLLKAVEKLLQPFVTRVEAHLASLGFRIERLEDGTD